MLAYQGDEHTASVLPLFHFPFFLFGQHQFLEVSTSNGYEELASLLQLVYEGRRNIGSCTGYEYPIVRCTLYPTKRTIPDMHGYHVRVAASFQVDLSLICQSLYVLDTLYMSIWMNELTHYSSVVPRSSSHFQHVVPRLQAKRVTALVNLYAGLEVGQVGSGRKIGDLVLGRPHASSVFHELAICHNHPVGAHEDAPLYGLSYRADRRTLDQGV